MESILFVVCKHLNNYFYLHNQDGKGIYQQGNFVIKDGLIVPLDKNGNKAELTVPVIPGQYLLIRGSILNDGIYLLGEGLTLDNAKDEAFNGAIIPLGIIPQFISLVDQIKAFMDIQTKTGVSAVTHESFGGYSYALATGANGAPLTWEGVFANQLNPYRKMYLEAI
jgi:hypothetical protein